MPKVASYAARFRERVGRPLAASDVKRVAGTAEGLRWCVWQDRCKHLRAVLAADISTSQPVALGAREEAVAAAASAAASLARPSRPSRDALLQRPLPARSTSTAAAARPARTAAAASTSASASAAPTPATAAASAVPAKPVAPASTTPAAALSGTAAAAPAQPTIAAPTHPPVVQSAEPRLPDLAGDARTTTQAMRSEAHAECTLATARNLLRNAAFTREELRSFAQGVGRLGCSSTPDIRYTDWSALLAPLCEDGEAVVGFDPASVPATLLS